MKRAIQQRGVKPCLGGMPGLKVKKKNRGGDPEKEGDRFREGKKPYQGKKGKSKIRFFPFIK